MGKETLKEVTYNRILGEIVSKRFPLDYIIKEKELAEKFGISRAPVREALIELSMENIVRSIPRAGYMIVQYTEKDIYEATDLRLMIEVPAIDKIVSNINAENLEKLRNDTILFNESYQKKKVPTDIWWNNNIKFHLAVNAIAGNAMMTSVLETVLQRLWRAIAQLYWSGDPRDYLQIDRGAHVGLLDAIEAKDCDGIREALVEDILSIRNILKYQPI
jgi:DNA-binding GntR family transcriptional regulator